MDAYTYRQSVFVSCKNHLKAGKYTKISAITTKVNVNRPRRHRGGVEV